MKEYFLIYSLIIFLIVIWIDRSNKLNDKKKKNNIIKIFNVLKLPVLLTCIFILTMKFICNNENNNNLEGGGTIAKKILNIKFLTSPPDF